jgi:hypothetical protein
MEREYPPDKPTRPRFGKLPRAISYSGRPRSRLYEWAAQYPGLFRKDGDATLVDFDILDTILDALPVAVITTKPPVRDKKSAAEASA